MEKRTVEIVLFVFAVLILIAGIFITVYTSTPIYEPEAPSPTGQVASTVGAGVVSVNVISGANK